MLVDSFFIFGAKYLYLIIAAIAGIVFLKFSTQNKKQIVVLTVVSLPLVYLLAKLGSHFYYDPRPFVVRHFTPLVFHSPDNGFPSDHVLLTSAIAALFYPFRRKVSYVLFFLVGIVAVSRVYVGVHHTIDVLGSFVIATATILSVCMLLKYVRGVRARSNETVST